MKQIQEKENFANITWYTHFKCKQRIMYLIYVLNNLSHSLSLSLSLTLTLICFLHLYISGPTVVYLLCIYLASTIIILICSPVVLLSTETTKATFLFIVLLYVVVKFSVSYNTCSCKLPIKVYSNQLFDIWH